jgi:hypothetical protein
MSSTTSHQMSPEKEPDIDEILTRVAHGSRETEGIAELSDLDRAQHRVLISHWDRLPVVARRFLVREMTRQSEENLALNFDRLLRDAMQDVDPEVRALSIAGLWEDVTPSLLERLCEAARVEREPVVLEALATALERYSLLASTGDLDPDQVERLRDALMYLLHGGHGWMVHRRALECLSYFCTDEDVEREIRLAAESPNERIQAGAIAAMGKTLDARWFPTILAELENEEPDVRVEAARAVGDFEDRCAIPGLVALLDDEDDEIRLAAIEAIGKIGGDDAIAVLESLDNDLEQETREAIERALSEARFMSGDEGPQL